jgi:hypothetical protein
MKRRIWSFALLLAVVAGIAIPAWFLLRPRQPVYQGKTMSAWVNEEMLPMAPVPAGLPPHTIITGMPLGTVFFARQDQPIINIFSQHPSEAVACLIQKLNIKDSSFWKPYQSLRARLPHALGQHLPFWPEPRYVRTRAAALMAILGPAARAAAPALCDRILHDPATGVRVQAIFALCIVAPDPNTVVATLSIVIEKDPSPSVRRTAIAALRLIDVEPGAIVPALSAALKDPDRGVRLSAAMTLGDLGPPASAALPSLHELASGSESDAAVVAAAHDALRTIAAADSK